ncbi:MAG: pyridoxamine 5'-phosphate oxidase [Rhodobacteraceae bacterium]|nr:MAG: pyridoxamine 5'-phosphate oxidase [Paracoccaceae bacterium]
MSAGDAAFDAAFYDDLDGTLAELWAQLARGAADRRSGFHTVQVATAARDGGARVRTVVLRGVDRAGGTIRFHTDARSEKCADIVAEPRIEVCAYDGRAKIQVRLRGRATVEAGDAAASAWAATRPPSRVCYRTPFAPGSRLDSPGAADPGPGARDPVDAEAGRANFRAVLVRVESIDWLYLAARGHRRARFACDGRGWSGVWLAP